MKIKKIWAIVPLSLMLLIVCGLLVYSYTAIGSRATPTGADGIQYVTDDSVINHTFDILFDEVNHSISEVSNLTLWTDLDGTWKLNASNATLDNTTYGFFITGFNPAWDGTVQWNIKVSNTSNSNTWLFSTNNTYNLDYVEVTSVSLVPATNLTLTSNSQPTINVTFLSTDTPLTCELWSSNATGIGTMTLRQTRTNVVNATSTIFGGVNTPLIFEFQGEHRIMVNCTKPNSGFSLANFITLRFDDEAPVVTVNQPSTASSYWSNSGSVNFTVTPVDRFISNCSLWLNSSGAGETVLNQTVLYMSNNTGTNFSLVNLADIYTNGYKWGYRCSDLIGNIAAANYTLFVDTVAPNETSCVSPVNKTRGTDYTPTLGWLVSGDLSFDRYTLYLMNGSAGYIYSYNITNNATSTFEITDSLTADTQWYWNISITDKAGWSNVSDNCTLPRTYYPDSVGHTLLSGYNFFSVVRNTDASLLNASVICSEPSVTPTSISKWNFTSNAWSTFVCGTSTNNFKLYKKDAVVFNMPSAGVWESGRIWDIVNSTDVSVNISNASSVTWNLIGVDRDTTLTKIDLGNRNITTLTAYNANNETSSTTIWSNVGFTLNRRYLGSLIVYNASPLALVPSTNYTINLNSGEFTLKTLPTGANFSGNNLTFDYTFHDINMLLWMSYPNHSQVNIPFKINWSLNGGTNVYDGDALWVNLNDTQQTSLVLDRSLW